MKLPLKILLVSVSATLVIALMLSFGMSSSPSDILGFFGLMSIIIGPLLLLAGVVALIAGNKEWAQGLLLSTGVLLLLGFLTCGSLLSGFH